MLTLPVLLGSVRRGRQSEKVARFVRNRLEGEGYEAPLLDLRAYGFPIMEERLHMRDDPPPGLEEFSERIRAADGVVVVSPEYNGGIPGVLKNALDYLAKEWTRKPVGIVSVSAGGFGGVQVQSQLQLFFLRVKALPIATLSISHVAKSMADDGTPTEPKYEKGFGRFRETLVWYAELMKAHAGAP